jgi:hypothetical protein
VSITSKNNFSNPEHKDKIFNLNRIKKSEFARLLRELFWKLARIDRASLLNWVKKFSPEVIFFCAGDSLFAYDIYDLVSEYSSSAKKVVYITDDYIMPRFRFDPAWWLRRNVIYSKMRTAVQDSDIFFTISEEMRDEYKKIFGKDSFLAFNMPKKMKIENFKKENRSDLILAYTGGLHFKRWESLALLAEIIKRFNKNNSRNIILKIYSCSVISDNIKSKLNIHGSSKFCGELDERGVRFVLNDADILVHVESFDRKCIESTRLSVSTKIFEYLDVGNKILAIGPSNIASMKFLKENAYCITSIEDLPGRFGEICESLHCFNNNSEKIKHIVNDSKMKFIKNVINVD